MIEPILSCCNHMEDRHLRFDDGTHICLTGRCRCGSKKARKKKPKRTSTNLQPYFGFPSKDKPKSADAEQELQ